MFLITFLPASFKIASDEFVDFVEAMGSTVSACTSCFPGTRVKYPPKAVETDSLVKYKPVSMPKEDGDAATGATVVVSPHEELLTQIHLRAEQFLKIVKSPASEDPELESVVDKDGCKVYTKNTNDGFVIRSEWYTTFPPKVYLDFIGNLEKRKTWDRNMEDMHLVEQLTPEISVFYQSYKKFFTISARDLVLTCKKFAMDQAWIDTCSSIEFPACPHKLGYIRAQINIGGYYVEALGAPEAGSKVISYTEGSFGGVLPRSIVKKFSATNVPHFVKTVNQALEAYLREEKAEM